MTKNVIILNYAVHLNHCPMYLKLSQYCNQLHFIESKSLEFNYMFAKDIKGADIKAHANVILENKGVWYNYYFAKYIY